MVISLLGMGISAFTYLDKLSTVSENTIIMLGTLVGTIMGLYLDQLLQYYLFILKRLLQC